MALFVGIVLGVFFGWLFRLHQKSSLSAALWSIGITMVVFLTITVLYYWLKKDPFDHFFGLQRYRTDWDNIIGQGNSKVWGPTESDWGPVEQHWSTATGLSISRYLMGYLSLVSCSYAYYLARRPQNIQARQDIEIFYENGILKEKGKLKYGFKDGIWEFYEPDGKLSKRSLFQEGEHIEDLPL